MMLGAIWRLLLLASVGADVLHVAESASVAAVAAAGAVKAVQGVQKAAPTCESQWENQACSGQFGSEECYTCGARIVWLVTNKGLTSEAAKQRVAREFIQPCGACGTGFLLETDGYHEVWRDEFDGEGPVDPLKWRSVVAGDGFGNQELQFYTNRSENAWKSAGTLKIRARRENFGGRHYTSAKLESKANWLYGKFHVRSRLLGTARGTWAAHWMLPTKNLYGPWPHSGEIDIMEHVGYDTGKFHGTVHTQAFHHSIGTQIGGSTTVDAEAWHTWTVEWRPEIILFAVDGDVYQIFEKQGEGTDVWPFNQEFYVILNMAVGGTWGGLHGIDEVAFGAAGQIFEVDWVRVEQRSSFQCDALCNRSGLPPASKCLEFDEEQCQSKYINHGDFQIPCKWNGCKCFADGEHLMRCRDILGQCNPTTPMRCEDLCGLANLGDGSCDSLSERQACSSSFITRGGFKVPCLWSECGCLSEGANLLDCTGFTCSLQPPTPTQGPWPAPTLGPVPTQLPTPPTEGPTEGPVPSPGMCIGNDGRCSGKQNRQHCFAAAPGCSWTGCCGGSGCAAKNYNGWMCASYTESQCAADMNCNWETD